MYSITLIDEIIHCFFCLVSSSYGLFFSVARSPNNLLARSPTWLWCKEQAENRPDQATYEKTNHKSKRTVLFFVVHFAISSTTDHRFTHFVPDELHLLLNLICLVFEID